jgi:hypothetical protein
VWGFSGVWVCFLGYLQSTRFLAWRRFRCVLESFNPFGGLGCGLSCSVESMCSSMSTFGESSMLSSFVEASSNGMPRIMHARTHARTHTRQEFHQLCLYVRALFCLNIGAPTKRNPLCTTLHAMSETRTRHTRVSRAHLGGIHGERLSFVCSSRNDEDRRLCFLCSYLLHPACGCL